MNFSLTRPLSKIKFTRLNQIYGLFDPRFSIRWYTAGSESKASNQNYFIQKDKKKTTPNKPGFHEYSNLFNEHHLSHDQAFKGSPPSTNSQENTDESSEKKILPTIQFSNSELPLNQDWMSKYMKPGQLFSIKDLTDEKKFDNEKKRNFDLFKALGTNPRKLYKHAALLSLFVTETGMIMHHRETNLTIRNQRMLSKTVKRARAMGLIPYTSKLPLRNISANNWPEMNFSF